MSNQTGRNIIICLDGTGNEFKENTTNVVKLFRVLERRPDHQIAYYDPGVGTLGDPDYKTPLGKKVTQILGLAFGRGIIQNVEEAYSFLMEHYQEGDRLFIFGYSRGAYTARALAAFLHACGLLESGCQNLIPYALELFRSSPPRWETRKQFKSTYSRKCPIHFLGLWDSVKSFGWAYDPIFLPYTTNNPSVTTLRHALAIDERRTFFQPMPWGTKYAETQDMKQVWFAGVHGDVGGGHPEEDSGLAKVALKWMIDEAQAAGLSLKPDAYEENILGNHSGYSPPNPSANLHDSLVGPWKLLQNVPRVMWDVEKKKEVLKFPPKIRAIPENAVLHRSVLERLKSSNTEPGPYQPPNLGLSDYNPDQIETALLEKGYSFEP